MKKKLIIIHPIDDYYGATRILAYTIESVLDKFDVEVWVKKDNGALSEVLGEVGSNVRITEVPNIPLIHSRMLNIKELWLTLKDTFGFLGKVLRDSGKDDLILINTFAGMVALFPTWISRRKSVIHCHEAQDHRALGRLIARLSLLFSDKVICVSDRVKRYVTGGAPSNKAVVVWNGINRQPPTVPDRISFPEDKFNIVLVGRLTEEKGYWFLADAVSHLPANIRDKVQVQSFGDCPPNKQENAALFQQYLKDKGLEDIFILNGFDSEACGYMAKADLVAVPSIMADPFPTTVLEAMRVGKAVVTTDHGGAKEIITNNETGFLCEPGNVAQLSSLLADLIENQEQINAIGLNANAMFTEHLTLESYQSRISALLTDLEGN